MTGPAMGTRAVPAALEFHTTRARNFPNQCAHRGPEIVGTEFEVVLTRRVFVIESVSDHVAVVPKGTVVKRNVWASLLRSRNDPVDRFLRCLLGIIKREYTR